MADSALTKMQRADMVSKTHYLEFRSWNKLTVVALCLLCCRLWEDAL